MNQATPRPAKRKTTNTAAQKAASRDKCTLLLDSDVSLKLSVAAHLRGLDRSELVNELLADALRYVVVSIRGQSHVSATSDAGVSQVEATAA